MTRLKSGIAASLIGGVLLAGLSIAPANATTVKPPEGGVWEYGVKEPASTVYVYSYYTHPTRKHRSSVKTSSGALLRSKDELPGRTAKVEAATGYSGNKAYYFAY